MGNLIASTVLRTSHPPIIIFFQSLQNDLNFEKFCKNFDSMEAIKNHITVFFDAKPRDFFGIYKLVERWKMIAENDGEYID